jgi:hypothetical protein
MGSAAEAAYSLGFIFIFIFVFVSAFIRHPQTLSKEGPSFITKSTVDQQEQILCD